MPRPGFEPGLLRPQRSVLTTRRSRLTTLLTADVKGKITSLTSNNVFWVLYGESSLLFNLKFAIKKLFLGMFEKIHSYNKKIYLVGNFHTPWKNKYNGGEKKGHCVGAAVTQVRILVPA